MGTYSDIVDRKEIVFGLLALQIAMMVIGLTALDIDYSNSTELGSQLWPALLVTAVAFAVAVKIADRPATLGLRSPERGPHSWGIFLVAFLAAAQLLPVITGFSNLPDGATLGGSIIGRTLLTTALVGFTEEFMFRGLLLTYLARRFGLRRGVAFSSMAFGLFHSINIVGGQSVGSTAQQVIFTAVLGFLYAFSALGVRSIIPVMFVHFIYDFLLLTSEQLDELGAEPTGAPVFPLLVIGFIAAVVLIVRGDDTAPYDEPIVTATSE